MSKIIGIDLGTSNSAAAVMQGDTPIAMSKYSSQINLYTTGDGIFLPTQPSFSLDGVLNSATFSVTEIKAKNIFDLVSKDKISGYMIDQCALQQDLFVQYNAELNSGTNLFVFDHQENRQSIINCGNNNFTFIDPLNNSDVGNKLNELHNSGKSILDAIKKFGGKGWLEDIATVVIAFFRKLLVITCDYWVFVYAVIFNISCIFLPNKSLAVKYNSLGGFFNEEFSKEIKNRSINIKTK